MRKKNGGNKRNGAKGRDRTADTSIFSAVLYRLSYLGVWEHQTRRLTPACASVSSRAKRCQLACLAVSFARVA
jgi:hypothetical protein